MKAIETVYNGYRFRSRTEARWAVAFDSIHVQYEYEKEGYELECGRYLPDFWLPKYKCFFEVKGKESTKKEKEKAILLLEATTYPVLIAEGSPDFKLERKDDELIRICAHGRAFYIGRVLDVEKIKNDEENFIKGQLNEDEFLRTASLVFYTDRNKGALLFESDFFMCVLSGELFFIIDSQPNIVPYRQISSQKFGESFCLDNGERAKLATKVKDESGLQSAMVATKYGVIKQLRQCEPFLYGPLSYHFISSHIVDVISETEAFINKAKGARFEYGEHG